MPTSHHDVCIIGAGLSGLSVARFLHDKQPDINFLVLEQGTRPGGAIKSHNEEGYLAEWGAHGFLDNCQESKDLIQLAGLENEVEKAPLKKFVRYVCLHGSLQLIPQQPPKIIKAPLISMPAKLRVLADLWKRPLSGEPSVADWVQYRFGTALLPFADAVFTGTYAGDIERLKIDAVMAGVRDLEREHGSVIRGVIKKLRASKRDNPEAPKKTLPAMTSFTTGMNRFTEGLAAGLAVNSQIMYQADVQEITRIDDEQWQVTTGENTFTCRHMVLAVPINPSLRLLQKTAGIDQPPMDAVPEAKIATIALGFSDAADIPFGFGYLAPESEQRFTLGALFSSHMFPGRAPKGYQLMEALVGGRRHPERLDLTDEEMVANVYADLRQLIHLPDPPSYQRVLRPRGGIPQLEAGYPDLLAWRDALHTTHQNLHVCGFGWKGIGINDMTKEAWKISKSILTDRLEKGKSEVKNIYF